MKVKEILRTDSKPRVPFCHECSRKLYGRKHMLVTFYGIDHTFVYHVSCAKSLKAETK